MIECRDHLANAHSLAADYIAKHNDWEDSIRNQGVMEPIWLAATTYRHGDGSPDVIAVVTPDGSSRLTAVHKILRDKAADFLKFKSADVPYRGDDDTKFRADLRRMNDWIESGELDDSRSAILRNMIVPAFLIVGFESERPGTTFHTAVKSLVALRHVDPPTPWGAGPEHESLADEVLDQLEVATLITAEEAKYLRGSLTREEASRAKLSPDPTVRAARIIDVFLKRDDAFKIAIRNAVTAQSTRKQSSPKLMKELAAALIVRGLDLSPREADQKRKYIIKSIPSAAERRGDNGIDWEATSKSHQQLMLDALEEVRAAKTAGRGDPHAGTVLVAAVLAIPHRPRAGDAMRVQHRGDLFSQGCHATHGDMPIRRDLCDEARRLAQILAAHPVGDVPAVYALLALMCFHAARFDARVAQGGAIVLLEEQDRSAWNGSDVREGMAWLARSATGDELTRYHVEAGIAWEHCRAPSFADTDWRRIAQWYDTLDRIAPSPLHALGRAVAEAYLHGPQAGLDRLAAVAPEGVPAGHPPWHVVIGELHFRLGRHSAAERAWREALRLSTARADQEFLRRRLAACRPEGGEPAAE
jgi:hypothetical protein